jgi:hypothetical protein
VLRPLPYFDSDQLAELRLEKAIDLQRYTRGWFARATAAALLQAQDESFAQIAAAEESQRSEAEARHAKEIQRRMHPHAREDFEILYNELEAWRLQETRRINSERLAEHERLEALSHLLLKEQKLLQTIDRLRLQANDENRDKRIRSTLQLMSSPKRWLMSDGEVAQVLLLTVSESNDIHKQNSTCLGAYAFHDPRKRAHGAVQRVATSVLEHR